MNGYKGFDKDFKCRGTQYKVGETVKHDGALKLCQSGLHFVLHPLDVFGYYPPAKSRFASVEAGEVSPETNSDDSKRVARSLKIQAELTLGMLCDAAVKFVFEQVDFKNVEERAKKAGGAASATGYQGAASATGYQGAASATGYQGAASATGDQGAASATGDQGAASATGYQGAASATGTRGAASATGDQGAASATGTRGAASATGYQGAASATGYQGAASATGYQGAASATGDQGAASATGYQGAAFAPGYEGKAKAVKGGWITLAEWAKDDRGDWQRIDVKTAKVDGKRVKADTYYQLKGGKFVEAE